MKLMIWLEREQLDEEFWFAPGEATLVDHCAIYYDPEWTK